MSVYFSPNQYVEFVGDYPTLLEHGFGFGIYAVTASVYPLESADKLLKNTVIKIILDFLGTQNDEVVLLYHYDHADNKQALRNRKFSYWYSSYPDKEKVVNETVEIEKYLADGSSKIYYMGYITSIANKNKALVKAEFEDFATRLTNEDKE